MYKIHGGSCRVDPWNEVMTGRREGKMDGVDDGKEGGTAVAAAAALCIATLKARYQEQYISSMWN